jgi:predicted glycosyltransferase
MAFASLVIGDSGSMVGEAAVLGTPAIYCGSFADRLEYLVDMERRGLAQNFKEYEAAAVLEAVGRIVDDPNVVSDVQRRRAKMLADNVDLSSWYFDLVTLAADAGPRAILTRVRRTRLGS